MLECVYCVLMNLVCLMSRMSSCVTVISPIMLVLMNDQSAFVWFMFVYCDLYESWCACVHGERSLCFVDVPVSLNAEVIQWVF